MMFIFAFRVLLGLVAITILMAMTNTLITRLPCRWHANFSHVEENKRYVDGVINILSSVSYTQCLVACVGEQSCSFVNHNRHTMTCELINVAGKGFNQGKLSSEPIWTFAATKLNRTVVSYLFIAKRVREVFLAPCQKFMMGLFSENS